MGLKLPKLLISLLAITLLILIGLFFTRLNQNQPSNLIDNQLSSPPPKFSQLNDSQKTIRASAVSTAIQSNLKNSQGNYSIYIKDLTNDQNFEYKSNEIFPSASIYKLAIMYKTFDALEKGEVEKDEALSLKQDANSPQTSRTVAETLRLMITISDNDSAIALAEKFGWANIEKFLIDVGIENFKLAVQTESTPQSTAQILERIYLGQAVSKQASSEMKKLLLSQTVNDRIPKYLPQNIKVAHKTGELETLRHDAGIVYGKKSDYIFVFFSDTPNPEDAAETIASLAKQIFEILEK